MKPIMLVLTLALLPDADPSSVSQAQTTEGVDAVEVMKATATLQLGDLGGR